MDQDERPQPELVRPLPWVFFLALLVTLRLTREGISLLNLVMGKPPLRSADVVGIYVNMPIFNNDTEQKVAIMWHGIYVIV